VRGDVFRYLATPPATPFDLIFADPPYALPDLDKLPQLVLRDGWLAPDGLFVLEHGKDSDFSSHPYFQELRTYGAVHFSFFQLPVP
jgi:16S rRNA G966 N2-methylase RsmD